MALYIMKRIAVSALTLVLIISLTFFLMNAIPGSPFYNEKSTPAQIELATKKYGLDEPLIIQFKNYLVGYLHGDWGTSLKMQEGTPVKEIILNQGKLANSVKLGLSAFFVTILIGLPMGCIAAHRHGKGLDRFLRIFSTLGISMPTFVTATLLMLLLSTKLRLLPVVSGELSEAKSYIMPVLTLASYYICFVAKLMRGSMIDVLNQDYIKICYAKGCTTSHVIVKHALRNSLIPVVAYLSQVLVGLVTGSFVVESIFFIPGLGKYYIQSILSRDYPLIMATTIVYATLIISVNLVIDIVYKIIDPRIRIEK